jgi:RNA polymerase sigma-70 factor (ECF subfamily)
VTAATADLYVELRPLLFSIAYRMLGTVSEAEDALQEAFLRYHRVAQDGTEVDNPKAYLTATVTRLCLDVLGSARRRRESYVGEWLPEPVLDDTLPQNLGPAGRAELAESVSMAFLVLLESLGPIERAVFLLRDVFGYEFAEISDFVGRSEDNCRQILVRARAKVSERRPRYESSPQRRAELAERFFAASRRGDLAALKQLLAADVEWHADGGGKAPAVARTLVGVDRVLRLFVGLLAQADQLAVSIEPALVNGHPGAATRTADGKLMSVIVLQIADEQIVAVHAVVNPDKLRHLGDVADVRALVAQSRGTRSHTVSG